MQNEFEYNGKTIRYIRTSQQVSPGPHPVTIYTLHFTESVTIKVDGLNMPKEFFSQSEEAKYSAIAAILGIEK